MKKVVKKAISTLLLLVVVLGSVFTLTACYQDFELIEIDDAYEQGIIDYNDLLNIAHYVVGFTYNKDLYDENFTLIEKGEIKKEEENNIKKFLSKKYTKIFKDVVFTQDNFKIDDYGNYKNHIAFRYKLEHDGIEQSLGMENYLIDGVKIISQDKIYLLKKL